MNYKNVLSQSFCAFLFASAGFIGSFLMILALKNADHSLFSESARLISGQFLEKHGIEELTARPADFNVTQLQLDNYLRTLFTSVSMVGLALALCQSKIKRKSRLVSYTVLIGLGALCIQLGSLQWIP